jgi:hypothetical protein
MEPNQEASQAGLGVLQLDRVASCYRLGPGSSERMVVLAPGYALREIEHIEINRFVERQGVTYYVLEVFMKNVRRKSARTPPTRVVGMSHAASPGDGNDSVFVDVELTAVPDLVLERRFSEFEKLRNTLSVCFENLHPGYCSYCDTFIDFLSCSSIQPGLFTKLTTRAPQRKLILSTFINRSIQLALLRGDGDVNAAPPDCNGWSIVPQVVESFLRETRSNTAA